MAFRRLTPERVGQTRLLSYIEDGKPGDTGGSIPSADGAFPRSRRDSWNARIRRARRSVEAYWEALPGDNVRHFAAAREIAIVVVALPHRVASLMRR